VIDPTVIAVEAFSVHPREYDDNPAKVI